jgi:hypothetical protein
MKLLKSEADLKPAMCETCYVLHFRSGRLAGSPRTYFSVQER